MTRKKLLVISGAIVSIPFALALGVLLAWEVNLRFLVDRSIEEASPADAFGMILLAILFGGLLTVLVLLLWERQYRKLLR